MADVTLPWAAQKVVVDLDTCIKTGRRTNETVTLRGTATPAWIGLLLPLSLFSFLFASSMTSRRYEVTVPFTHASYDHWATRRTRAAVIGLAGAVSLVAAAVVGGVVAGVLVGVGLALLVGGIAFGVANGKSNGVAVRVNRHQDLILVGTHPAFADGMRAAEVGSLAPNASTR